VRALAVLLLIGGCLWQSDDPPPLAESHVQLFEWPGWTPPKMDVLFVVDDTAAMAPYVDRTAAMLRGIETLWPTATSYGMPDLHVAVATESGQLHLAPSVHGAFVSDEHAHDLSGTRVRNFDGGLGDAIEMLGAVGTSGGVNQPLNAVRAAISNTPGFLRGDAYLAIVIVSASDDTSEVTVKEVVDWAKAVKSDPGTVLVSGVFPENATRLADFVSQFPDRGTVVSLDASDYTPAIAPIARFYTVILSLPCLDEPADVDPLTPDAQFDCTVELVGEDGSTETEPPCPYADRCWTYRPDPMCSVDSPAGRIEVTGFSFPVMPTMRGQCVVAN